MNKKKIDYKNLSEITVKSQEELDDIPDDFEGRIYIEFGIPWDKAIVRKRYYRNVEARGNSSVVAWENSSVEARENSSVVAWENSSVEAWENSSVEAWENSSVVARENSSVEARENSSVVAWENSSVEARENSSVVAWENSSVEAWENSSVEAWENSSVVARENSSVVAGGNTQVVSQRYFRGRIKLSGNARTVYMPDNIEEFMNFYGIKHTKTKATFYKAVNKYEDGSYHSNWDSDFIYEIGKKKKENCDANVDEDCSSGIHISHLNWALDYSRNWNNLAILEVETKISDIVLPKNTDGKVRTSEVKVIREVPLEECGLYGKILAKRRSNNDSN